MKTTINAQELRNLDACEDGLDTFVDAHGEKTVSYSQALESNGWADFWWLLRNDTLSDTQLNDLRLLACDYAEDVLHLFESKCPDDKRPRQAIETARKFAKGQATIDDLKASAGAAWAAASGAAARDAADAARDAAVAAAGAAVARAAAGAAAWYAADDAQREKQTEQLKKLITKWEIDNENYN